MVVRAAVVLVALLVLTACSGGGGETAATEDMGAPVAAEGSGTDGSAAEAEPEGGTTGDVEQDDPAADGGQTDGVATGADEQELPDAPPPSGDRIIKEGTISLEVEEGEFDRAFIGVVAAARRHGGDVVGSSTRTGDDGETFGSVTVRVPVGSFEDLLVGMGEIGATRSRDVDATDVTAEYTDLESRLRHLRAQERFYLGLLDRAESVRDAIAVQQQLDGIQGQIEQIQGRLNVLTDRTSFSSLTVELFEPGAGTSLLADDDEPATRPTLARYWATARDAFVNVLGAMLVAGLFAFPLLLAGGAAFIMWRLVRRPVPRRRTDAEQPAPPAPADAPR